jgi:hypothetical protein
MTKPQIGQLQEMAQKTGLSTQQIRSWFTRKRTKAQAMNQAPSSGQQIPQQHISQPASGSSTARTGPHKFPTRIHLLPLSLSARSPSTLRSNRPAFLDAYFNHRKFNEGKPRFDIDGTEKEAAIWYTNFHNITLDQLQQANDCWYPPEQDLALQAPSQAPMQLQTPSPSSPSPSPEAPTAHSHVKPGLSEAEDQDMGMDVDVDEEGVLQNTRLQILESVLLDKQYHLPPTSSPQELFSNLHSDSIASFTHAL